MPVFVTYLPDQTFSRLVAGISYENIFRLGLKKKPSLGGRLREDCLCSDSGQYYRYFLSQMLEAFPTQIPKISVKTFPCLFWSPAITLEPICESDSFSLECPVSAYLLKLTLVE